MIKKLMLILLVVIISTAAKAEEAIKIGVVDFGYIMTYSNATKSISEQVDAKKEEFMAEDKAIQASIVKKQQGLSEQKAIISSSEFERARKSLEAEIRDEQGKSRRKRIILENGIKEARVFLDKAVRKYVAKVAEEKGLSMVLPQEQVIISAKELSITDEVFKLVNSDLKEVKINFAKLKADAK